jgi:hypothetical protein
MSPKFSIGADAAATGSVVAGGAAALRPALVDVVELLTVAAGPLRVVAAVDGAADGVADGAGCGFGAVGAGAPAVAEPVGATVAGVVAGVGAGAVVAGAGSGVAIVGVATVDALFAGVVGCASVDVAGMTTVAGRRSAMNASTPPPTTSATTKMPAVAR